MWNVSEDLNQGTNEREGLRKQLMKTMSGILKWSQVIQFHAHSSIQNEPFILDPYRALIQARYIR